MTSICVAHPLSFLDMPPEIRLLIYRNLLISPRTIGDSRHSKHKGSWTVGHYFDWEQFSIDWHGPGSNSWKRYDPQSGGKNQRDSGISTCGLSGQLLATCKIIHEEGSAVLYGENAFGLHIHISDFEKGNAVEASFYEGHHIGELDPPWPSKVYLPRGKDSQLPFEPSTFAYQFAVDKIRKLRLVVNLDHHGKPVRKSQLDLLKHALQTSCERLERVQLQHLNIHLRSRHPMTKFCVLDSILILRNLQEVTFKSEPELCHRNYEQPLMSLPPQYKGHLKRQLESSDPPGEKFLESYNFQAVAVFLSIEDAPPTVWERLRLLINNRQRHRCLEGPFETCEHRVGDQDKRQ